MTGTDPVVFLFDVDNTLLDNDQVRADLSEHLEKFIWLAARDRYWAIFETLNRELGYYDYFGALELYRLEDLHSPALCGWQTGCSLSICRTSLYPRCLGRRTTHAQLGDHRHFSDGDAVFQPRKVERSGLWQLVENRVLIYVHREEELEDVERFFPARHYVMIDDKLQF